MKTREQIRKFVRVETGEQDSSSVDDLQIDQYINYGQLRVQNEFAKINFKMFTKFSYHTGATFEEPADILNYPNSVINLLAGAAVRAFSTVNYTGPTAAITHTVRKPGTAGNNVTATVDGGTYSGTLTAGQVSCVIVAGNFHIDFGAGSTITQIITGLNSDPVYSQYFICSSATTGSTVPVPSVGQSIVFASGTGAGFYPATELSSENFIRSEASIYKAPSLTSPKFRRFGNTGGRIIEVLPNTVTYCMLEYFYRLADLTADTDTLSVPAELEELVLIDVMRRVYEKAEKANEAQKMEDEYSKKFKEYVAGYLDKRQSEIAEKGRMQSSDVQN